MAGQTLMSSLRSYSDKTAQDLPAERPQELALQMVSPLARDKYISLFFYLFVARVTGLCSLRIQQ